MIKIGIIYGGVSTEHDVSEMSAKSVIDNLDKKKYDIQEIYINKYGKWFEVKDGKKEEIYNIMWTLKELDVVFPVLHGLGGEDGSGTACSFGLLNRRFLPSSVNVGFEGLHGTVSHQIRQNLFFLFRWRCCYAVS